MAIQRQEVTREQLDENLRRDYRLIGHKSAYCDLIDSCEECDAVVRFGCMIIRKIEEIQKKRILRICR